MTSKIIHKSLIGVFGGTVYTSLCGRLADKTSPDGYMNVTNKNDEVTCKLCLKRMKERIGWL